MSRRTDRPIHERALILDVGLKLAAALVAAQISREEFGRLMGTCRSNITQLLDGKSNLQLATIASMAKAIGMVCHVEFRPGRALRVKRSIDRAAAPRISRAGDLAELITSVQIPRIENGLRGGFYKPTTVRNVLLGVAATRHAWIGLRTLAARSGVTATILSSMLRDLERAGLVEIESRPAAGTPKGHPQRRYLVREASLRMIRNQLCSLAS